MSIENQSDLLYTELKAFLLNNKEVYLRLYDKEAKIKVDLISFSQGFQVSLATMKLLFDDKDLSSWLDFRIVGVCPVANGVYPLNCVDGSNFIDLVLPIEGPFKNLVKKAVNTIGNPFWKLVGRITHQQGLTGFRKVECERRANLFQETLKKENKKSEDHVFIIHSKSPDACDTLLNKLVKVPSTVSNFYRLFYKIGDSNMTNDGLLTKNNQTGNFPEVKKVEIEGDHMDIHSMNTRNPNIEWRACTDGNEHPFYHLENGRDIYLLWGATNSGTADKAAQKYWELVHKRD